MLPFEDISSDPGRSCFVNGLTIDLVTDLARFQSLHVVCPRGGGREAVGRVKTGRGTDDPAGAAANYVVSGSVRRTERRILVTAQLEDAGSGVTLWADRFDRPFDDLFGVQKEVSERIAARLVSHVEREQLRRTRHRPTASLDAYDLCLRGRDLFLRMAEADTLLARDMFDQAIAADPDYGPAHAWQANAVLHGLMHWWGEPTLAELRQIAAALPDFGLCQHSLVVSAVQAGRMDEARAAVRNTLRIGPRWTLRSLEALWSFHRQADKDRFRTAFAAAGMPDRSLTRRCWEGDGFPALGPVVWLRSARPVSSAVTTRNLVKLAGPRIVRPPGRAAARLEHDGIRWTHLIGKHAHRSNGWSVAGAFPCTGHVLSIILRSVLARSRQNNTSSTPSKQAFAAQATNACLGQFRKFPKV